MIIECNQTRTSYTFADVKPGQCFRSINSSILYMKTKYLGLNAVAISDGVLIDVPESLEVNIYPNAKVVTGDQQ